MTSTLALPVGFVVLVLLLLLLLAVRQLLLLLLLFLFDPLLALDKIPCHRYFATVLCVTTESPSSLVVVGGVRRLPCDDLSPC